MITAGDSFLRSALAASANTPLTRPNASTLGSGQPTPPPTVPAHERSTEAQVEIDAETRRVRDNEKQRVHEGPPPWGLSPDEPTSGGTGAQGPGGYKFDAETIAAKITQWEQIRDDIAKDGIGLEHASQALKPPSPDQPATEQSRATSLSIGAAAGHNFKMRQYAQAFIDALRKANGTYVQHDENVSSGLYGDTSGTGDLYK